MHYFVAFRSDVNKFGDLCDSGIICICRSRMRAASYFPRNTVEPQYLLEGDAVMIVTFCGHKDIFFNSNEKTQLKDVLRTILKESPNTIFYLGDYGQFDSLCNRTLKELQKEFPLLKRIFVTPYLNPEYTHLQYANHYYDEILYPFTNKTLPRFAISKRNQWMVDESDLIIAYIDHGWGGAARTLEYAIQKHKPYINLSTHPLTNHQTSCKK